MNTTAKTCLFGGTLLAAGLTAQTANAQALFVNYNTNLRSIAMDYNTYTYVVDYIYGFAGGGYTDAMLTTNNGTARGRTEISFTGTSMANRAYAYGYGMLSQGATVGAQFVVTQNGTASWGFDPTGDQFPSEANTFRLTDLTNNVVMIQYYGPDGIQGGSVELTAGNLYFLEMYAAASDYGSGGGASQGWITIPAPGATALLGIAGLVATRRRR